MKSIISSSDHRVVLVPSLIGCGYRPSFTPLHHVDLLILTILITSLTVSSLLAFGHFIFTPFNLCS